MQTGLSPWMEGSKGKGLRRQYGSLWLQMSLVLSQQWRSGDAGRKEKARQTRMVLPLRLLRSHQGGHLCLNQLSQEPSEGASRNRLMLQISELPNLLITWLRQGQSSQFQSDETIKLKRLDLLRIVLLRSLEGNPLRRPQCGSGHRHQKGGKRHQLHWLITSSSCPQCSCQSAVPVPRQ